MTDTKDPIQEEIGKAVAENPILLFMKGTPDFPQCGFSATTAGIMNEYGVPYAAVNVLLDNTVREGIKVFSDWPTIPQLYIGGEFIGGCDIVKEMHANGELQPLIDKATAE